MLSSQAVMTQNCLLAVRCHWTKAIFALIKGIVCSWLQKLIMAGANMATINAVDVDGLIVFNTITEVGGNDR